MEHRYPIVSLTSNEGVGTIHNIKHSGAHSKINRDSMLNGKYTIQTPNRCQKQTRGGLYSHTSLTPTF